LLQGLEPSTQPLRERLAKLRDLEYAPLISNAFRRCVKRVGVSKKTATEELRECLLAAQRGWRGWTAALDSAITSSTLSKSQNADGTVTGATVKAESGGSGGGGGGGGGEVQWKDVRRLVKAAYRDAHGKPTALDSAELKAVVPAT
jgi:hypothetical protein